MFSAKNSGPSDGTGGDSRSSEAAQYDVMDFSRSSAAVQEQEANVYLTIPDDALSQANKDAAARSDSAIKRAEFAEKLTGMTDEDFSRQFQVLGVLRLLAVVLMIYNVHYSNALVFTMQFEIAFQG